MKIGCPKEIMAFESRVGIMPTTVKILTDLGHEVFIEKDAGVFAGFLDDTYMRAGAKILPHASQVWQNCELIVKVKEPLPIEYEFFHSDLCLFTFLHLAANKELALELLKKDVLSVAYETIEDSSRSLPILEPMSAIAGKMATQVASHFLESHQGGKGILLGGIPGVRPANIVIIGAGVVGLNACQIALGMGALVTLIDKNQSALKRAEERFCGRLLTKNFASIDLMSEIRACDILILAVLNSGAIAPKIITKEMVANMEKGSVIVDVAIDQGGACEASKKTTHENPVFMHDGVIHYCVANMPGAVAKTSTLALSTKTSPYIAKIAEHGAINLAKEDKGFALGLHTVNGFVVQKVVAQDLDLPYKQI